MCSDNIDDKTPTLDNDNLNYTNTDNHQPWTTIIRGKCTCTANIYDIQKELLDNNKEPITRESIAKVLQNRNLLQQTKTMQTSSNNKYILIQFNTSQLMETFCSEPFTLNENFQVTFLLDFRKKQRQAVQFTFISFLNIPSEADEDALSQFVQQFATVAGYPRYPAKTYRYIEYFTGTPINRVFSITKHIPHFNFLFGTQIKCIYTRQPEQTHFQSNPNTQPEHTERHLDTDTETESDTYKDTHSETDSNQTIMKQTKQKTTIEITITPK